MEEIGRIKESTTSSFVFRSETEIKKHDYIRVENVLAQIWEVKQLSDGIFGYANIIGSLTQKEVIIKACQSITHNTTGECLLLA